MRSKIFLAALATVAACGGVEDQELAETADEAIEFCGREVYFTTGFVELRCNQWAYVGIPTDQLSSGGFVRMTILQIVQPYGSSTGIEAFSIMGNTVSDSAPVEHVEHGYVLGDTVTSLVHSGTLYNAHGFIDKPPAPFNGGCTGRRPGDPYAEAYSRISYEIRACAPLSLPR